MAAAKKRSQYMASAMKSYGVIAAIYLLLIFVLPENHQFMQEHNVTSLQYREILFMTALPSMVIWLIAFYGYAKLQEYTHSIRSSLEAPAFQRLARGAMWLAWALPIPTIMALIAQSVVAVNPELKPTAIIITNYASLIFPLVAFSYIGAASYRFLSQSEARVVLSRSRNIVLTFVTLGVLYCYLVFRHLNTSSLGASDNAYYLPIWLIVTTSIIPYLYAWFAGLLASYEIVNYCRRTHGVLYRQALHLLVLGIVAVIIGSVVLQYVSSVQPNHSSLMVDMYMVDSLVFRTVSGAGFILLTWGALKLKKIEEV